MIIADLVVADAPAGFETWADGRVGADLAIPGRPGEVLNSIDPELLEVLDFISGYLRCWTDAPDAPDAPDGKRREDDLEVVVGVVALEFADVDGAGGLIDAQASLMTLFPDLEIFRPTPGDALDGLVLHGETGFVASCLFALGRHAIWIFGQAPERHAAIALVQDLAPAQLALAEGLLGDDE